MCLVSILPEGTEKYSDYVLKFIKNGFECNKDGSGFMFKRKGEEEITVDKGYFDYDLMILNYKNHALTDDDEVVFHHRVGTQGLVSKFNTHPYVCSDINEEINVTTIKIKKPCLAHNGFIHKMGIFEQLNPDFSDTYAFARYFMSDKNLLDMYDNNNNLFTYLTKDFTSGGKIAILRPDKPMIKIGPFIDDNYGYSHSNGGYCRYVHDVGGSSTNSVNFSTRGSASLESLVNFEDEAERFLGKIKGSSRSSKGSRFRKKIRGRGSWDESMKTRSIELMYPDENLEPNLITHSGILKCSASNLKFGHKVITIDETNFDHFVYINKYMYAEQAARGIFTIKKITEFNLSSEKVTYSVNSNSSFSTATESKESFLKNHYFIPIPKYVPCYKGFVELVNREIGYNFGLQTLKKLEKLCYSNRTKDALHLVWYNRHSLFYPLLSLKLFKELVKYEIEFDKAKNTHVPSRIIETLGNSNSTVNKVIELFPNEDVQNIILDDSPNNLSLKEELDEADKELDGDAAEIIQLNNE